MPSTAAAAPLRRQAPKTGWLRTPGAPCGKTPIITRIPAIYDAPKSEKAPGSIGRSWGKTDAAYPGKDVISGSPDIVNCFTLQPKWSEAEPGFGFDPNSNLVEEQPVFSFFGPLSDPRLPILMVNDNLRNSKFKVTLKNLNEDFYNQHEIYLGSFPVVFVNQGNSLNGNRLRLSHPATEVEVKINPAISPLNFTLLDSIAIISKENGEERFLSDCSLPITIWKTKVVNLDFIAINNPSTGVQNGEIHAFNHTKFSNETWNYAGIMFQHTIKITSAPTEMFDSSNKLILPLNQFSADFFDQHFISGNVLIALVNEIGTAPSRFIFSSPEGISIDASRALDFLNGEYDNKVIVIGDQTTFVVPHELGHMLGKFHPESYPSLTHSSILDVSNFDPDNIMIDDAPSILFLQAIFMRGNLP